MDNHGVEADFFLEEVHKLDYSIVSPNKKLNNELHKLQGRKIIYTNANKKHALDVLERIDLTNFFDEIFDIKMANYIPKPEIIPYNQIIELFNIDANTSAMFDDIAKNLVPLKKLALPLFWLMLDMKTFQMILKHQKNI